MSFYNKEYLLGILLCIALLRLWLSPRKSVALRFPSISEVKKIKNSWRVYAYRFLPILKFLGLVFLILALARPQAGDSRTRITTKGIAIMMAIDVSGSMRALDFSQRNVRKNRLQVVKEVFKSFVEGGEGMPGRSNDLIGLVVFGGFPESKCPLTLDHNALVKILEQVKIPKKVVHQEELQTAIGDAIAIGVERLRNYKAKSKILLLLTDGENTAGVLQPLEAAEVAKTLGVKIYTIGVGTNGVVPFPAKNPFTGEDILVRQQVSIDEDLLKEIAKTAKGRYFNARNKKKLGKIYKEIDKLERQEIKVSYLEYRELYLWFLIPGFLLILLERLLAHTVLRKVP